MAEKFLAIVGGLAIVGPLSLWTYLRWYNRKKMDEWEGRGSNLKGPIK